MRKLLSFFVLVLIGLTMFAQAPQRFTYQAVVRNESNTLVRGTVGVRVSILQGGVDGTVVYQETHTATTNINGLMTLEIGGGTVLNGDFATIDWATGPYFLKTETDPDGGTNYTIEGTQQLLSVPYALYAGSAANSFSGDYNDLTNVPPMPQIPENVSAFNNDAGYITMDSIPEIPTVPTNVSAFANDAGYVTENDLPSYQVLSISNDTIYLTNGGYVVLPTGFSGDYNDLTNPPQIPTVPTNVSAFENDAHYITTADVPTIPTNVSAFTNDAGYITMDSIPEIPTVPTNVSMFTNDAGYITMDSIPAIPTVPTNVSAFVNDAGYITESTLTTNNYITQNDLVTNNYVTEADIPTNVSAFTNDAGYITMDSIPAIPTVPTNISAFVNDAGYLTTATVQEAANIPTNVSAFNNDANYITAADVPAIPTNVSAFENDANYITSVDVPAIPANVSAFTNDAGYLTSFTEQQVLTISNDTLFLTGGSFVKLPAGFDGNYNSLTNRPELFSGNYNDLSNRPDLFSGDYNDLTNQPTIPTVPTQVSAFENDANYITTADVPTNVSAFTNDANYITSADVPAIPTNVSSFTNDAGYITMDSIPEIPAVPTNISAFVNDAGYLTTATVQEAANIPTNVSAFTNDANYITAADVPAIPTNVSAFENDANYITSADVPVIPTNVSAFTNDAGYLTSFTEQQVLTISNDTLFLTGGSFVKLPAGFDGNYNSLTNLPELFSGSYNDLTNKPTIPTVPSNVSSFNNDANYITAADVPAIPANISAFTNDANYITTADIPAYQVLSISNDTIYLSNGGYAVLPAGFDGNYNSLSNKPDLFSGNYNDLTDKPTIPTVPTNVSAFTNDANYITSADVPAIPANVSSFTNDAGYITMDSIPAIPTVPTQVSAFENDAHYLTSYTEQQVLSISNDTIFLTGGSFAKLPAGFSGSYNDLTDVPENVSTFTNDAGYLTRDSLENYNLTPSDIQALLDRIEELEQVNELPACSIISTSSHGENGVTVNCKVTASGSSEVIERGICWSTAENPTIGDAHTPDGTNGLGTYILNIGELSTNTTYHIRAYATNATGTAYSNQETFSTVFTCGTSTIMDRDSNIYNTVLIGTQCWMKENLRTTKYADGTSISNGSTTSTTIAYWYYPNNDAFYKTTYGLLYNWKAVMGNSSSSSSNPSGVQGICPTGWHVPSDAEWTQLTDYVGSHSYYACIDPTYIAKALAGTTGWRGTTTFLAVGNTPSDNNATNFSSLPANCYPFDSNNWGKYAYFWSSTSFNSADAWRRVLVNEGRTVERSYGSKTVGSSVRCVRD